MLLSYADKEVKEAEQIRRIWSGNGRGAAGYGKMTVGNILHRHFAGQYLSSSIST